VKPNDRVHVLDWDSKFWGVRAGRATVEEVDDLNAIEDDCRRLAIDWLSLLIPVERTDLINAAVRRDFDIVDVRHTLQLHGLSNGRATPSVAGERDTDEIAALAATALAATAFSHSRFAVDRHLNDARCAEFYETWVRNSFGGAMGDAVVVVRSEDGRVSGFITTQLDHTGSGSLQLAAVRPDQRRQGVGTRLLDGGLAWMSERQVETVTVVTQLGNKPAVRLWESAGFQTVESAVWLHRWFTG